MELLLNRVYLHFATHGELFHKEQHVCFTIEEPWKNNESDGCIPEGRYELKKKYSESLGWHLEVKHVPERAPILIHASNFAENLKGCIAPVTEFMEEGEGTESKAILSRVRMLVFPALSRKERVFLHIVCRPRKKSPVPTRTFEYAEEW